MHKIRIIQNAATFVSDLKVSEMEVLQKQNPMALAIEEPNMDGGVDIVFSIEYKNTAFGDINDNKITFVDKDAEGYACLTVLIPANVVDRNAYLYEKYAGPVNLLKTIERKAKKALENLTTSKDAFAKEFLDLDSEITLSEAFEDADIIVKAPTVESKPVVAGIVVATPVVKAKRSKTRKVRKDKGVKRVKKVKKGASK